ncbi:MAG: DUF3343 domain-containing protein [Ruminococcus sp.]|nr:DUF3343 domain-containing protein [Ruminococcus sp.]
MRVCIVEMPSYTYAVKGEKLLSSRGYPCKIKRNISASPGSCGYSLFIYKDVKNAVAVLEQYRIPYTRITYGGE